ncbi:MAG: hypothetical protein LBS43_04280 [Prevotellaceae bacterium]|nr:hypothetical protein [Prevotellaceae bacterium]
MPFKQWDFSIHNSNVPVFNRNIAIHDLDVAFKMNEFCYRATECSSRRGQNFR